MPRYTIFALVVHDFQREIMKASTTLSEIELIALLKSNNQPAFEYLYQRYSTALYSIALKIVKDKELAADILQDSFLKIWKNMSAYNSDKGRLFTWMLNVTRNTAIDKLRSEVDSQRVLSWDMFVERDHTSAIISTTNFGEIDLHSFIEKLPPERKEVIQLVYFQGYTHEEVSKYLMLPLGTVKSRVRKALEELRSVFSVPAEVQFVS